MQKLNIRKPDDFHVHFRSGAMMRKVVPYTAAHFARALVMPNTEPPIIGFQRVAGYALRIRKCLGSSSTFQALMTFKITPSITIQQVKSSARAGAIAGKLYPDGVTTNSNQGVRDFAALYPIFACMEAENIVLCLHGEHPDAECMDREKRFVDEVFYTLVSKFPHLRIVLEHISTKAGVNAVLNANSPRVAGTITVHHLELTHSDVFGGLLKPHLFCKPIAKWEQDREELLCAATSGSQHFFFGSDSAPHPRNRKECAEACAGVFSAPVALPVLAEIFEGCRKLDMLEPFVSEFGARFYGLPLNEERITLVGEYRKVLPTYSRLVPYRAGDTLRWRVIT